MYGKIYILERLLLPKDREYVEGGWNLSVNWGVGSGYNKEEGDGRKMV